MLRSLPRIAPDHRRPPHTGCRGSALVSNDHLHGWLRGYL